MRGWRWIALGVAGILGATAIVSLLVGDSENTAFVIPSESMQPTLQAGERVQADLNAYKDGRPEINDIVVFYAPRGAAGGYRSACGDPATGATGNSGTPCAAPTPEKADLKFIKRIVAGPGDTVAMQDGHPVVNGVIAKEDFIEPCRPGGACDLPTPITIPPDHWFLLGDNRGASDDSRFWGPIPTSWIIGRVAE